MLEESALSASHLATGSFGFQAHVVMFAQSQLEGLLYGCCAVLHLLQLAGRIC